MKAKRGNDWTVKGPVLLLGLAPMAWIWFLVLTGQAGPNPVEFLTHESGQWGLRLLLVTLAMTPLRRVTGWTLPIRLRRMLGLLAFSYVVLHFLVFAVFDHALDPVLIADDVINRPYILVGFLALLLLIPLAVTSTNGWMRRLGRRWKQLHRLVYAIAILGVVHFLLLVRADPIEPLIYGLVLAALLLSRLRWSGFARATRSRDQAAVRRG